MSKHIGDITTREETMATTTNYIHDLASMRQFIRSLTFGNHNRGKVTARGIKGSQHDDIIRRLDYFGIIPHIYTKRIGKASIHHLSKDDFIDGYNYLNNLYELYAAVPEQIFVQLCILAELSDNDKLTIVNLNEHLNLDTYAERYKSLSEALCKQRSKKQSIPQDIDQQYIQRQVKTLETIGIIVRTEHNKGYTYGLKNTIIDTLTKQQLEELALAVFFFTNVSITSAAGHILLQKIMYLINGYSLKQQQESIMYGFNNTYFTFKDNNPNNVIDGDIFYPLADALYRHKKVRLTFYEPGKPKEIVTPLSLQTYYGENKNLLYSINNSRLQVNRIDRIKSLEVTKFNSSDFIPQVLTSQQPHNTCILHFLISDGYEVVYDQFTRHFKEFLTVLRTTDEYIELQLEAPDLLQLLPLLRSYLPYLYIISSNKPSIKTKFYSNLYASLGIDFIEPEGYKTKKKLNPFLQPSPFKNKENDLEKTKQKRKQSESEVELSYVSPILNDINSITFTTQYQIQLDLVNDVSYTKQDIDNLINHRRLLTTAVYKKALRNDEYEQLLAHSLVSSINDTDYVESIFSNLPLVIISDVERMFLKDLINDERVNWLLSQELREQLAGELISINTTFPSKSWRSMPTMTDDTPLTMDVIIKCLQSIQQNVRITIEGKELSPCRLEYSVGSNGYSLIAYDHQEKTFIDCSLRNIKTIMVLDTPRLAELETIYASYRSESKNTLTFVLHDSNNAVDRCFNYFSNYTIQAQDVIAEEFIIEVSYLPFQEQDILRNLLKLGCAVRIVDECPLREKLEMIYKTTLIHAPSN